MQYFCINCQKLAKNGKIFYILCNIMVKKEMTYEELSEAYKEECEWNDKLSEENKELKKFVEYVHSLKTKDDFLTLRNKILEANKKIKWKRQ